MTERIEGKRLMKKQSLARAKRGTALYQQRQHHIWQVLCDYYEQGHKLSPFSIFNLCRICSEQEARQHLLDLTDKGKIKVFYDGNRQNHNKTWIPLVKPDGSVPILHAKPNPEIKIIGDVQVTICPPRYATGYKLISFEQLTKT